jgi:hypothetical protein
MKFSSVFYITGSLAICPPTKMLKNLNTALIRLKKHYTITQVVYDAAVPITGAYVGAISSSN